MSLSDSKVLDWYKHVVLMPAFEVGKKSKFTNHFGKVLILAFGSHHSKLLSNKRLSLSRILMVNQDNPTGNWPKNSYIKSVNRIVQLFKSDDSEFYILQTHARKGMNPPAEHFDRVFIDLLNNTKINE